MKLFSLGTDGMIPEFVTNGAYGYLADYGVWCFLLVSLWVHAYCFFKFFPRRRFPKLSLLSGNALIFACLGGCVAWVGETYLRFFSVGLDAFGVTMPAQRWFQLYVRPNGLGFRDEEWPARFPEGHERLVFLGDSFTYGWGIEEPRDRFADRVGRELTRRRRRPVHVMNVARPGWDTGDQLEPLQALLEHYPIDEVILCYVPNDIERLLPVDEDFDPTAPPRNYFFNTDSSFLIEYLYYRIYLPFAPSVFQYHDWLARGYEDEAIWRAQRDRLDALIQACLARDVPFRVVVFPFLRTGGTLYDAQAIHARLRTFFQSRRVPVVDLWLVFKDRDPKPLVVSSHDSHPNETAHALAAQAILDAFYSAP